MTVNVDSLTALLEREIAVAEELDQNLTAQKQAILDWNVESLLEQLAAREPWLRLLAELEQQRGALLGHDGLERTSVTLRQLIAAMPAESAAARQLSQLQSRARQVFLRLQAEERNVTGVMTHLLAHVQQAMAHLTEPKVPVYGENGMDSDAKMTSALLQSRA